MHFISTEDDRTEKEGRRRTDLDHTLICNGGPPAVIYFGIFEVSIYNGLLLLWYGTFGIRKLNQCIQPVIEGHCFNKVPLLKTGHTITLQRS